MGPQNIPMDDSTNFGLDLPRMQTDDQQLAEIQKTAKFSKTKEFQELKKHLEGRITFYQTYLPGGQPITDVPFDEVAGHWIAANVIISELNAIIGAYEEAARIIKDAVTQQKRT